MRTFTKKPTHLIWRLLWLAMLVVHAPATAGVLSSAFHTSANDTSWAALLLLSGSNLFFLLEVLFASSLRWVCRWQGAVVFVLVVAILHVGVIERGFPSLSEGPGDEHHWLIFGAMGLAVVQLIRWTQAAGRRVRLRELRECLRQQVLRFRGLVHPPMPAIRPLLCGWRFSPLRAPPA